MNSLLYLPGYLLTSVFAYGIIRTLKLSSLIIGIQVILALPFLIANPSGYMHNAFNFSRKFRYD